jgi:hypothetical protein
MLRSILQRIRVRSSTTEPYIVVRGRFRVWQWVVLSLAFAAALLIVPRLLLQVIAPIVVDDFCAVGVWGVTIGWWKAVLVLSVPIIAWVALGFLGIYVFDRTRKLTQYPPSVTPPLVDTRLRQGQAVRFFAIQNLIGGVISILLAVVAIYFLVDMTREFGMLRASDVIACKK